MNLIYDIYKILADRGSKIDLVAEHSDIVNAVVGCGVHFDNVGYALILYSPTHLTFVAGVSVNRMQAVYCLCKYLCIVYISVILFDIGVPVANTTPLSPPCNSLIYSILSSKSLAL